MGYDGVKIGDLFSESYFDENLAGSKAWNVLYKSKYRSDLTAQNVGVKNIGSDDDSNVYEVVEINLQVGGGAGVTSVNGLTNDVILYSDSIAINNTNNDSVETGLIRLSTNKLNVSEHKVSSALDVEPTVPSTRGLMFFNGNQHIYTGVIQEGTPVLENMRLSLASDVVYSNTSLNNNIIPLVLESSVGSEFTYLSNGVELGQIPQLFAGWGRFTLATTCRKQTYPLRVEIGVLINGVPGSSDSYTFNYDELQGFQLNAKNDAVLNDSDLIQFYISTDKPLGISDKVTILQESYAFVEDRGKSLKTYKLERAFLQGSNISLRNTTPSLPISSVETLVPWSDYSRPPRGTAFIFNSNKPTVVTASRDLSMHIQVVVHVTKETGGNPGAITIRLKINGSHVTNGYRREEVDPEGRITKSYQSPAINLLAGDEVELTIQDTGQGNLLAVTDANHAAIVVTFLEV